MTVGISTRAVISVDDVLVDALMADANTLSALKPSGDLPRTPVLADQFFALPPCRTTKSRVSFAGSPFQRQVVGLLEPVASQTPIA